MHFGRFASRCFRRPLQKAFLLTACIIFSQCRGLLLSQSVPVQLTASTSMRWPNTSIPTRKASDLPPPSSGTEGIGALANWQPLQSGRPSGWSVCCARRCAIASPCLPRTSRAWRNFSRTPSTMLLLYGTCTRAWCVVVLLSECFPVEVANLSPFAPDSTRALHLLRGQPGIASTSTK